MPIFSKKVSFKGVRLHNGYSRAVRWISPDSYFGVETEREITIPLVTREWNLPKATISILAGSLPAGLSLYGNQIVGTLPKNMEQGVFTFTLRAESTHLGRSYYDDRIFNLVVTSEEYDFRWVTPEGLLDADVEGTPCSVVFVAKDTLGLPITYSRVGGPLPTGLVLESSTGRLIGNYPEVEGDKEFTFVIEAFNGFRRITREFTISVWDRPSEGAPEWVTPKGPLANLYEGMIIDEFLEAIPTTGENDILYTIKGGSPPAGASFEANGVVYGLLGEVEDDTLYRIIVGASADNGNTYNKRLFEILVRQNWPPEWPESSDVLFNEVEGYELEAVKFEATDRNSPDQSITYYLTANSKLPPGITFDPYTGVLSGVAPAHKGGNEPDEYTFTIRAHDSLKFTDKTLKAYVEKNLPPVFANSSVEYFGLNGDFLETAAHPASDPNRKPIVYSITGGAIPQGWDFDPATGVVSGILPPALEEDVVFDFVLTASDSKFNVNQNVRITSWINTAPVWETTSLRRGLEGKPYEAQLVAVDRELKPVNYRYLSGDLPPGLTVESSGRVVGFMPYLPDGNNKTIQLVVEADDGVMQSVGTITLEIQKNLPPYWISEGQLFEVPGQRPIKFTLEWVEPNDQPVYFEVLDFKRSNQKGKEPHNDIERWNLNKRTGQISGIMPHTFDGDVTYTITLAVLDGDHPYELFPSTVRTFTFVRKQNLYPVWTTEKNLLALPEGSNVHAVIHGYDPEGEEVIYYRSNGLIWRDRTRAISLQKDTVTGQLPNNLLKDQHIDFSVALDDQTRSAPHYYRTPRTFRITALYDKPPRFLSPELLFKRVEDTNYTYQVRTTNRGNAETILITLTAGSLPPGLTMTPDGLISGRMPLISGPDDVEYVFELTADNTTKTTTQTFRIINEKNIAPYWETPQGSIGSYYANNELGFELKAVDPNENRGNPLRYSAVGLPTGLTLGANTGVLSGLLPILLDENTYTFNVTVTDGMYSDTRTFSITQKANEPPVFISDGTVASSFDSERIKTRVVAKDPENEELTYTLVSGSTLPGDLVLNPDGTITGNTGSVTVDVDYPFEVEVADSFFNVRKVLNLRVIQNLPPVWITPEGDLADIIAGESFRYALEAYDPNDQEITFHLLSGVPPKNFSLDPESGTLSFTTLKTDPSRIYNLLIGITDGRFMVAQQFSFKVRENKAPSFISLPGRLFSAHVNEEVNFQLVAEDDHDYLEFTLRSGDLPPGLTLLSDGQIVGKTLYESPAEYAFAVEVSDGHWDVVAVFSIELLNDEPIWVTENFMGQVDEHTPVNVQLEAYDPEGAEITYEMAPHPTLSLTPSGLLTGVIPAVEEDGFVSVDVVASDGIMTTPRSFSWDVRFISPPMWITDGDSLPSGPEQYAYATSLIAKANNQNITYIVVSGDFPSSLTLDPDGTIHGNLPLVTGDTTFEFEVEAEAADGKRSSAIFRLMVYENLAPVWETPMDLEDMPHDTKGFSLNFLADDPNGTPLTYTLVGGTPPFPIDFGDTNSYALMRGDLPELTQDTTWTFTIGADDGFIRTERTFSITGLENKAPQWMTPAGIVGTFKENTFFDGYVTAKDERPEIQYTLLSDDFPVRSNGTKAITFNGNRFSGRVEHVFGTETFSFTMEASDGEKSSVREFKIVIENDDSLYDPYSSKVEFFARAENGIFDEINRNLVPQYFGSATASSGRHRFGQRSYFGSFSTSPSYIKFDGSGPFQLASTIVPEWTMEAWLFQETTGGTQNAWFIGVPETASPTSPAVGISAISGMATFVATTGEGSHSFIMVLGEIPNQKWTHVAVSRDASGTIYGFIDGRRVSSRPNSTLLDNSTDGVLDVYLAGSPSGTQNWNGYIDEVRLTHACRYTDTFTVGGRRPVPPKFISADGMLVASGQEMSAPSEVLSVSGKAVDEGAITEVRYQSLTPGYSIDGSGKLLFEKYPAALDASTDHPVLVAVLDSNGNLSKPQTVLVRSTAASVPNLVAQWRLTASHNLTIGSGSLDYKAASDGLATAPDGSPAVRLADQMRWTTNLSQLISDFTVEFWLNTQDTRDGSLLKVGSLDIQLNGGSLRAVLDDGTLYGEPLSSQWTHIAVERSGEKVILYMDGTKKDETVQPANPISGSKVTFNDRAGTTYYRATSIWKVARYLGDFEAEWPGYGEDSDVPKWLTKSDLGTFAPEEEFYLPINYRDPLGIVTSVTATGQLPMGVQYNPNDMTIGGLALAEETTTFSITLSLNTRDGKKIDRVFTYTVLVPLTGVEWITDGNLGEIDGGSGIQLSLLATNRRDK